MSTQSASNGSIILGATSQIVISSPPSTPLSSSASATMTSFPVASSSVPSGVTSNANATLVASPSPVIFTTLNSSNVTNQTATTLPVSIAGLSSASSNLLPSTSLLANVSTSIFMVSDSSTTYTTTATFVPGFAGVSQTLLASTSGVSGLTTTTILSPSGSSGSNSPQFSTTPKTGFVTTSPPSGTYLTSGTPLVGSSATATNQGPITAGQPSSAVGSTGSSTNTADGAAATLQGKSSNSTPTASVVAGGAVGGTAGLAIILVIVWVFFRWRQRKSRPIALPQDDGGGSGPAMEYAPASADPRSNFLPVAAAGYLRRFTQPQDQRAADTNEMRPFEKVAGRKLPSQYSPGMVWDPSNRAFDPETHSGSVYSDTQGSRAAGSNGNGHGSGSDPDVMPVVAGPSTRTGEADWPLAAGTMMPGPARTPVLHQGRSYEPISPFEDPPPPPPPPPQRSAFRGTAVPEGAALLQPTEPSGSGQAAARRTPGERFPSFEGNRSSKFTEDVT